MVQWGLVQGQSSARVVHSLGCSLMHHGIGKHCQVEEQKKKNEGERKVKERVLRGSRAQAMGILVAEEKLKGKSLVCTQANCPPWSSTAPGAMATYKQGVCKQGSGHWACLQHPIGFPQSWNAVLGLQDPLGALTVVLPSCSSSVFSSSPCVPRDLLAVLPLHFF